MNTGTCKGLGAVALCLALSACDDLNIPGLSGDQSDKTFAASKASLGRGTVSLVPPDGFCIDTRSVRQSFAIMARCDTLGAPVLTDAPLAVITATTIAAQTDAAIDPARLEAGTETVLVRSDAGALSLVQVQGRPPSPEMRNTYWRAAGRVGNQVLGLALYQAADRPDLGDAAMALLVETMQRTSQQTEADAATRQDNSATADTNQTAVGFRAGLFE
ncbi:MAG: hypothetical protein AB3N09_10395 [Tateyamaria sp.]